MGVPGGAGGALSGVRATTELLVCIRVLDKGLSECLELVFDVVVLLLRENEVIDKPPIALRKPVQENVGRVAGWYHGRRFGLLRNVLPRHRLQACCLLHSYRFVSCKIYHTMGPNT